jgi:hypothetical protein
MKLHRLLPGALPLYLILISSGTHFSSCTKKEIIHDTLTHTIRDTLVVKDTVVVADTSRALKGGLIAYFNFNNGSLQDSSGYNNHIIFNSASKTIDRFGNPNNAYLFDGSSSFMEVKNNSTLNPGSITMFAIIKINGFNNGPCHANQILGKGNPDETAGLYFLRFRDYLSDCNSPLNPNAVVFHGAYGDNIPGGTAAGVEAENTILQTGKWYSVAYTYDGYTSKLYANGVLLSTLDLSVNFAANMRDLFIGRSENDLYPFWFNGVIDEIRIYNRALSVELINKLNNLKQ